jgi:hypothetical protein
MTTTKSTQNNNLHHAHRMSSHWLYLANKAAERGDYDLEQRHLERSQKWLDKLTVLEGRGEE